MLLSKMQTGLSIPKALTKASLVIQAKLIEEIDGFGPKWDPSYDDLEENLPYLDAVINESLRIHPPAFLTLRETEAALEIDGGSLMPCPWNTVVHHQHLLAQLCHDMWSIKTGLSGPNRSWHSLTVPGGKYESYIKFLKLVEQSA